MMCSSLRGGAIFAFVDTKYTIDCICVLFDATWFLWGLDPDADWGGQHPQLIDTLLDVYKSKTVTRPRRKTIP